MPQKSQKKKSKNYTSNNLETLVLYLNEKNQYPTIWSLLIKEVKALLSSSLTPKEHNAEN